MSVIVWCALGKRARLLGLGVFLLLPGSPSFAQSVPVLGYVAARNADPKRLESFRRGMTELGYAEGKNISIDFREAVLDAEYYGVLGQLLATQVELILAPR